MSKTKATVVQLSSKAEPMEVGGGANDEEDEEEEPCDQCRVCTIRSDCFSYYNINEKLIFKNIRVAEALTMVTSIQVRIGALLAGSVRSHETRSLINYLI